MAVRLLPLIRWRRSRGSPSPGLPMILSGGWGTLAALLLLTYAIPPAVSAAPAPHRLLPLFERSVEVDPQLPAYRGLSAQAIASAIARRGYRVVRYNVQADSQIHRDLIDAFQQHGMGVWYTTFMNGAWTTKDLPAGWQEWKMITRGDLAGAPPGGAFTRLCLNNPHYREWKKAQIVQVLHTIPFQGIDLKEPYWPDYPGPGSPTYACFCPSCRLAFHRMFPQYQELPDVVHPGSRFSPQHDPGRWRRWLQFRQVSVTAFLDDLVNGPGGIRARCPGVKVCTWSLALSGAHGLRHVLEDNGEDIAAIVRTLRPDACCLETHWPDWERPGLRPGYVRGYRGFIRRIRDFAPDLPVLIEADTGSPGGRRRDRHWILSFEKACRRLGVSSTLYEFSLGK